MPNPGPFTHQQQARRGLVRSTLTLGSQHIALPLAAVLALCPVAAAQQPAPYPAGAEPPPHPTGAVQQPALFTQLRAPMRKPVKPAAKPATRQAAAWAAAGFPEPALLGQYAQWSAFAAQSGGRKMCYALAKPSSSKTTPANKPRGPVFLFVASRPAENLRNEVYVTVGYAFKPATDATVEIGPAKFAMYTQKDGAWIRDEAEESRLVETMRKSSDLIMIGTSSRRETQSVDRYSLDGFSQALDRTEQECKWMK